MRILVQVVLPLLLPLAAYLAWTAVVRRYPMPGWWRRAPWPWLIGSGVALVAVSLVLWAERTGFDPAMDQTPPRSENGRVVPGGPAPR